ncbi:MAG: hypothetical protein Ct9H90mP5_03060 [Acidimicrobiaceae bacterium]|nr:MAG: hypothetical protein Ct9H90mP5_03060 [Acidimicrobiaceae bacterium]
MIGMYGSLIEAVNERYLGKNFDFRSRSGVVAEFICAVIELDFEKLS